MNAMLPDSDERAETAISSTVGKFAKRSCQSCKLRKRKCTRELPQCRLCIRGRRQCFYQSRAPFDEHLPAGDPAANIALREQPVTNHFPVALFLDPALYDDSSSAASRPCRASFMPSNIKAILGDIDIRKDLLADYFSTANRWLPIVSKIRFHAALLNDAEGDDVGVAAILMAMKLLLSSPKENGASSTDYVIAKEFMLHMEMAGCINMRILQASTLIAMYELGHAIFPGVLTSISTCARYASILDIHSTLPVQGRQWLEQEERNRAWWAIVILDRSVNLGCRGAHLCWPDPDANSILPIDEDAWDAGSLLDDQIATIISPPSIKNGRYARLAQAANLLSQVYGHASNPERALRVDRDNITQLERTLFALENLASYEEHERQICCLSSIATSYSAILLLHSAYMSEPCRTTTEDGRRQSQQSIREVLAKTLGMFDRYRRGWGSIERFPPLALPWLYQAATAHLSLGHDAQLPGSAEHMAEFRGALERVAPRWGAAAHYVRLLETRQIVRPSG